MASPQTSVNVEQQILNIIASTVPNEVKKTLVEYCCKHSLQNLEKESCHGVFKLAIQWILCESDALLIDSGELLLKTFAQNETTALVSFFTESILLTLLKADKSEPSRKLCILNCVFPYLKTSKIYSQLCEIVSQEITTWPTQDDIQFCGQLSIFLKENSKCLPDGKDELSGVNILLVQCLGKTKIPNASKDEMIEFFRKVHCVCELLHMIWDRDSSQSFIMMSVKECFEILSNPNYQSTVALASLTNYIPDDVINSMIHEVTVSTNITENVIFSGLSKMMQWLVWPKQTKVAQWLLTFFKCLVKSGKKHVLQRLIQERILMVSQYLVLH